MKRIPPTMSTFGRKAPLPRLHWKLIRSLLGTGAYMRRREFICVLGGMAPWPLTAQAQQRVPQIGILLIGGPEPMGPFYEAMRHRGYIEGRNIQFVVRSGEGDANRLPELATDLVRAKVDIIVASLTPSAIAAKNATREIPIVMAPVGDPSALV